MADELAPQAPKPYNPLEKRRLAESIVREMLSRDAMPLPLAQKFIGAGIYAIYYRGSFELYSPLAEANADSWAQPIYVGQAAPPGGRKGGLSDEPAPTSVLFLRLGQHASSIQQAENLAIEDFACRYLVVDDVWIGLAETLLIEGYRPLWNVVIDGFGNHDPGSGRHAGKRPTWDTLHPGRSWAGRLQQGSSTIEQIEERIRAHFGN